MIGRDHVEPARQQPVELEPAARAARRVQEEHWLAPPAAEQVNAAAVEVEEFFSRGFCQLVTSVGWSPRPTLSAARPPGNRQSRIMCRTTRGAAPGLVQVII
jgi:predicted oxidoreductase